MLARARAGCLHHSTSTRSFSENREKQIKLNYFYSFFGAKILYERVCPSVTNSFANLSCLPYIINGYAVIG